MLYAFAFVGCISVSVIHRLLLGRRYYVAENAKAIPLYGIRDQSHNIKHRRVEKRSVFHQIPISLTNISTKSISSTGV